MDSIITAGMANNFWVDTLNAIDVPDEYVEAVKMHFIDANANTPLQFIAQLITVLFTHDGSPLDENAFKLLLRRYKGGHQQNEEVRRHIRRTLFALINYADVNLTLQLSSYNIFVDTFDLFEDYLNGIDVSAGGNKKKRSAKRKSSRKRSTRSKK